MKITIIIYNILIIIKFCYLASKKRGYICKCVSKIFSSSSDFNINKNKLSLCKKTSTKNRPFVLYQWRRGEIFFNPEKLEDTSIFLNDMV